MQQLTQVVVVAVHAQVLEVQQLLVEVVVLEL
jgi:hypothetical protein